jgi:hypothetical protein
MILLMIIQKWQVKTYQIDVSSDLENWTTVYGPTPDPQYSTMMSQRRFYEFTSGSTSAQFVKLYLNGTSTKYIKCS